MRASRPVPLAAPVSLTCSNCYAPVPAELASEQLCALHFTHSIEESCNQIRRDVALGRVTLEAHGLVAQTLKRYSATLALLVTGTQRLADDVKKRVLTTFWTLMIVQETLCRHAESLAAVEAKKRFFSRGA
jgi:hypothetical protein